LDDRHAVLGGILGKSEALIVEGISLVGGGHSKILGNGEQQSLVHARPPMDGQ
jgi:hypothetical protein